MKFKVLLRKRGGARARAAAGVERGAANTMSDKYTVGSIARNQSAKHPLRPVQKSGEGRGWRTRSRGRWGEVPQCQQSAVLSRGTRLGPA